MAAAIFVSYRRSDSGGHAGRLHDRLALWYSDTLASMNNLAITLWRGGEHPEATKPMRCAVTGWATKLGPKT